MKDTDVESLVEMEATRRFEAYKAKHGKAYKDSAEYAKRRQVFLESERFVEQWNSDPKNTFRGTLSPPRHVTVP